MSSPQSRNDRARMDLMILVLAVVGGGIDTLLIISFNVLTGAQTGNTVLLGADIALGHLSDALSSLISVICYVIGVAVGELLIVKHRSTWLWPSAVGTVLMGELIALGSLFVGWHLAGPHPGPEARSVLIACAASAMGLQSAAMLRLGKVPTTTYVTGTLTTFATNLVRWLDSGERMPVLPGEPQDCFVIGRSSPVDGSWIYGLTWVAYLTASVVVGLCFLHVGEAALLLPLLLIILIIVATRYDAVLAELLNRNPETDDPPKRSFRAPRTSL
jgi:uncharacterized membrane protein YoaK (UPF0700 family)